MCASLLGCSGTDNAPSASGGSAGQSAGGQNSGGAAGASGTGGTSPIAGRLGDPCTGSDSPPAHGECAELVTAGPVTCYQQRCALDCGRSPGACELSENCSTDDTVPAIVETCTALAGECVPGGTGHSPATIGRRCVSRE